MIMFSVLVEMAEYSSKSIFCCLLFSINTISSFSIFYVHTAKSLYKIVTTILFLCLQKRDVKGHPQRSVETQQPKYFLITIIVVGCVTGVVLTAVAIYLMMRR